MKVIPKNFIVPHIYVLNDNGILMSTKFLKTLDELPEMGKLVNTFYDETFLFYDALLNTDLENKSVELFSSTKNIDELFYQVQILLPQFFNIIANSTITNMEDITKQWRDDEAPILRQIENAVDTFYQYNYSVSFNPNYFKNEYSVKEALDVINALYFTIQQILHLLISMKLDDNTSVDSFVKSFIDYLNKIVLFFTKMYENYIISEKETVDDSYENEKCNSFSTTEINSSSLLGRFEYKTMIYNDKYF